MAGKEMLTFLKKTRKSMIDSRISGKKNQYTRNYMVYAIGEIILVVIGILLALQINNWNENRKSIIIEKEYLLALEKEFEANQKELNYFISLNLQLIETTKDLLLHTGMQSRSDISEDEMNGLLNDLLRFNVEYEPSPGILEDLISSGNLNRLSNTTLRKHLSDWKAKLANVRRQEGTVLEYRSNIKNLLIEKGNTRSPIADLLKIDKGNFNTKNISLLTDNRLENNLSFFAISSSSLGENYYKILDDLIKDILKTIQIQLYGKAKSN